jgi:glycosyltransferase involved in cell wall biosynthesis
MIAAEGLGDRVRLTGAVAHDAMPGLMAAADVMALASASEGLANVWVEALACGTPIVVPDVGGAREVVTDPPTAAGGTRSRRDRRRNRRPARRPARSRSGRDRRRPVQLGSECRHSTTT